MWLRYVWDDKGNSDKTGISGRTPTLFQMFQSVRYDTNKKHLQINNYIIQ
jgi:hypothetical protein